MGNTNLIESEWSAPVVVLALNNTKGSKITLADLPVKKLNCCSTRVGTDLWFLGSGIHPDLGYQAMCFIKYSMITDEVTILYTTQDFYTWLGFYDKEGYANMAYTANEITMWGGINKSDTGETLNERFLRWSLSYDCWWYRSNNVIDGTTYIGQSYCVYNGELFLFSGKKADGTPSTSIFRYRVNYYYYFYRLALFDEPRLFASAAYYNSKFYIIGGYKGDESTFHDTTAVYNIGTNTITYLTQHIKVARYKCCFESNYMYIAGGITPEGISDKILQFNMLTYEIKTIGFLKDDNGNKKGYYDVTCEIYENNLFCFGGVDEEGIHHPNLCVYKQCLTGLIEDCIIETPHIIYPANEQRFTNIENFTFICSEYIASKPKNTHKTTLMEIYVNHHNPSYEGELYLVQSLTIVLENDPLLLTNILSDIFSYYSRDKYYVRIKYTSEHFFSAWSPLSVFYPPLPIIDTPSVINYTLNSTNIPITPNFVYLDTTIPIPEVEAFPAQEQLRSLSSTFNAEFSQFYTGYSDSNKNLIHQNTVIQYSENLDFSTISHEKILVDDPSWVYEYEMLNYDMAANILSPNKNYYLRTKYTTINPPVESEWSEPHLFSTCNNYIPSPSYRGDLLYQTPWSDDFLGQEEEADQYRRIAFSACEYNNKIYIFGDWWFSRYAPYNNTSNDLLSCYDITLNSMNKYFNVTGPSIRRGTVMNIVDNKIYIYGGFYPTDFNNYPDKLSDASLYHELWIFDLSTGNWTQYDQILPGKWTYSACHVTVGTDIYYIFNQSGCTDTAIRTNDLTTNLVSLFKFDTINKTFTKIADMDSQVCSGANHLVHKDGELYYINKNKNEVKAFNPITLTTRSILRWVNTGSISARTLHINENYLYLRMSYSSSSEIRMFNLDTRRFSYMYTENYFYVPSTTGSSNGQFIFYDPGYRTLIKRPDHSLLLVSATLHGITLGTSSISIGRLILSGCH